MTNTPTNIHNLSTLEFSDLRHIDPTYNYHRNIVGDPTSNNDIQFSDDISENINNVRICNPKKIIIGHLNINSIRNKIDELKEIIRGIDIFAVTESKLDDSFPISQFNVDGFREPFRKDRSIHGGGILVYIRADIPCKLIKVYSPHEIVCIEVNFRKVKWLLITVYYPRPHPGRKQDNDFLFEVGKVIDFKDYQNIVVIGDINLEQHNDSLVEFMSTYNLSNLIKVPTCYKSINNPTSIDVILTNKPKSFQSSSAFTSGLSDFHKLIITILKTEFVKLRPSVIKYRCYKHFQSNNFNCDLYNELLAAGTASYNVFQNIFQEILNIHAPFKSKTVRANNAPCMNKNLRKAIITRSRLKNKYLHTPNLTNREK